MEPIVNRYGYVRIDVVVMSKSPETRGNRARAAYYSKKAALANDAELERFWNKLAEEWIALDNATSSENEPPTEE